MEYQQRKDKNPVLVVFLRRTFIQPSSFVGEENHYDFPDAAGAVITASSTSFNAALDAYRNGVGAITEVNVAQSQLLQAKIVSIDAHSAALSAAAGLALATGALGAAPE